MSRPSLPGSSGVPPAIFGLVLAAIFVLPAFAIKFAPLSIERLRDIAQVIVHGTVREKICERDPEGRIYTRVTLDLHETWKGSASGPTFTFVQGGGTLGEQTVEVSGQENFEIGEEVVLFLVLNKRSESLVIGLSQGKFKVRHDPSDGRTYVHNLFHGNRPGSAIMLDALKQRVKGDAK